MIPLGKARPFGSIRFFGIGAGANIATPYVEPIKTPYYLCLIRTGERKDEPLAKYLLSGEACPTGALTFGVRM